ncbi:CLUMA_CG021531, isoform A [Clunio marinus]|uniref:CLUMA_CG021531, isoform A n=1 Tax=Clunio marinus TaxID=568069 RepID=A0A1J1J8M4_9DIPT|nr:CLUMA_CG021531, isoform A [Clunio marinus]
MQLHKYSLKSRVETSNQPFSADKTIQTITIVIVFHTYTAKARKSTNNSNNKEQRNDGKQNSVRINS